MTVFVTPAEQELARLDLELGDRLGEAPDDRMKTIVNAPEADPPLSAHERAFRTQLELARRAGLMQAVAERSVRGVSNRAAVREVLRENPAVVGEAVLADLALARAALGVIESREAEKARIMLAQRDLAIGEHVRVVVFEDPDPSSGLPETSESSTEVRNPAR
jgi:hypothetical protein